MDYSTHALSLASCAQGAASRVNQAQNVRRHPFSGLGKGLLSFRLGCLVLTLILILPVPMTDIAKR